ncbi:TonB-dependent receptor [Rhodanobacter sp. C03]|uniref:TonB-dependent receptor domain-containing protein n=1 Tax=Rhodanobacter sp. C03 TaxID=1945858 RepID=UPI0009851F1C|nr:TonB-dependent receptor [Rhodanobacter sp. C03]OOG59516.1 TonB-dependent receptor [Rhodanobacter sp. C03]
MKLGVTKLSSSVRLALSLGAVIAVGASGTAFAQDTSNQSTTSSSQPDQQKAKSLQTVVVTGSLIRRVDLETASPVVTIDRAQIQATGKMTLGDLVQQLPAMTGGAVNPQVNNGGGTGGSSINLRGLGSKRTLILVDGQRLLSKDPNAIPADAVERIEVLPTGASATYGSDAIGGVVNFILRKDYQGAQFTANVGESDHNDGDQAGYTFTFGQSSDKGSIMAGLSYNKQDGVLAGNRSFSKNALTLAGSQVIIGGSSSTPVGRIQVPAGSTAAAAFANCPSDFVSLNPGGNSTQMTPANYHCYTAADKYNYSAVNLDMTPQERTGGFINGEYHLGDHVSAYVDAIYEKTSASFQLAPAVYGTDTTGASLDPFNAFNPNQGDAYNGSALGFRSRLTSVGPRFASSSRTDAQINTGFRGDFTVFDKNWNWDVGLNYGHESIVTTTGGLVNQTALYTGPSTLNADGTATCPAGVSAVACQFNPFDINAPASAAAARAAVASATSNQYLIEKTWHAGISGELFSLPAGAVQLAVGAEYRQERDVINPDTELLLDPTTGSCILGSQCLAGLQGGYNTKDLYAEAFIPILSGLPGVQSLNLTIGDRYSRVSTFGNTNNFKFALEWKPIDDLLLRGTMEEVFRAPSVSELFSSGSDAPNIHSDPCTGYTGAPAGSPLALACQFVPTDGSFVNSFVQSQTQASAITEGASVAGFPIKPESGKSYDFGAVYSPSWVPGLSTTVDLWRVNLNNTITSIGMQSVLNLCASGQTVFCQYIKRVPSGQNAGQLQQGFVEPTANLGALSTGGVDFSANYKLPQFSFGQFNIGVNATYLKYYQQNTGSDVYNNAGHLLPYGSAQAAACPDNVGVCLFPRWRGQGFVDWQQGNWSASWRMRYIGRFQNGGPAFTEQDTQPNGVPGTVLKYGATVYNDVSFGYNIEPYNTRVDVGVNNLFDKQPPMLYANNTLNANTDPSDFDLMGRYFWARVTVKF